MNSKNYDLKIFVREQGDKKELPRPKNRTQLATGLHGEEAKSFYEEVLSRSSIPSQNLRRQKTKTKRFEMKKSVEVPKPSKSLFQLALDNDVDGLKELVGFGVDVNLTDDYGWTGLMCAACSGSEEAVKILLEAGANKMVCDKAGNNAASLARNNCHNRIVFLLKNKNSPSEPKRKRDADQEQFCGLCGETYHCERVKHEASTVHLLKRKERIKTRTFYGIPEYNKGFQLLMRQGWDREHGLGPEGSGRKFPIKAHAKTDRSGIGLKDKIDFGMENPENSLEYLKQLEAMGEEILRDRQEIVALDIRRNEAREALRALSKTDQDKTWLTLGPMLVKMEKSKTEEILKKDINQVDIEINKIRSNLKEKVNTLRDMEHQPPVPGLMLKPMSSAEMNAIGQTLGRHAE